MVVEYFEFDEVIVMEGGAFDPRDSIEDMAAAALRELLEG